ncbi:TPA: DNA polymerase I [Clostridium perfringens]|nr:DNA polymerase I [Clostridium perfringens]
MQLNLNLDINNTKEAKAEARVKEAKKKKALAKYEPTWDEVWVTGYKTHTGATKKAIFQTKLTDIDKEKLLAVKEAIESGELQTGVESLSKFTKTKALGLWVVLKEIRRESIIKKMVEEKPENYHLILNPKELHELTNKLDKEEIIAVDTETTGVEVFGKDYIVGISLTLPNADYHCYIPIRHVHEIEFIDEQGFTATKYVRIEEQLKDTLVFNVLKPFLENPNLKKMFHNSKFDIHMFRKEGVVIKGLYLDTMVAMHLLNENEPSFALKNLATKYGRYFGFEDKSMTYEELFGKGGFEKTPLDIGTVYACKDTHLTYKFGCWILEQFERLPKIKKLYFEIELPITEVCIEMEKNGFAIDLGFAEQYKLELQEEIKGLEDRIREGFGEININSNQQLQKVIYEEWGVPDDFKTKVDAPTLKQIVSRYKKDIPKVEYINDLLKYRELNKLLTTYIEPLPQKISPIDGRLHGSFNQSATVTGRFASNNPNLQNLPYPARKMFVAPEGKLIIGSDFSQIEPRFLSHISQDADFMGAYLEGRDLYSEIASKTFKVPIEECCDGSIWRKKSKVVLLGCMYGISAMSLAEQFNLTLAEAEQIYTDFYGAYPTMTAWFKATNDKANELGYVETTMGRKRRFLGHKDIARKYFAIHKNMQRKLKKESFNIWEEYRKKKVTYAEARAYQDVAGQFNRVQRQSINAVIQGSSADIMKKAMVDIYRHLQKKGSEWKLLGTIHDEVLVEIPATATIEEIQEIADIQRNAVKLSVPMKCDVAIMKRWGIDISLQEYAEGKEVPC